MTNIEDSAITAPPYKPLSAEPGQGTAYYAVVRLIDIPYHVDIPYTYYLTPELYHTVKRGMFVLVPFGLSNRQLMGIVTSVSTTPENMDKKQRRQCKPVIRIVSETFVLNEELLGLCGFIAEYTFCTFGDAAKTILPAGALRRMYEQYEINAQHPNDPAFYAEYPNDGCMEREVYDGIRSARAVRRDKINDKFGADAEITAERLVRQGYLVRVSCLSASENRKLSESVRAVIPRGDIAALLSGNGDVREKYRYRRKSEAFDALLRALYELDGAEIDRKTLLLDDKITWSAVRALEKMRIAEIRRETEYRNPYESANTANIPNASASEPPRLSAEQTQAYAQLSALYDTHQPKAALLYGVTGSGKTSVIKAMMDHVLSDNRQVIMLVPEISLTPQSVAVFCSYYGSRVAVVHSGLSAGERLDVWRRVQDGLVDIVIGTRSAVFAPFPRLGMIVIDEEQEHTYKSDTTPKYHARDIARYRCAQNNALLLLASATPSFESFYKAEKGIYTLVRLTKRYGNASLPSVIMADMRASAAAAGEDTPLGKTLSDAIRATKNKNEQAILFINRRGYHKYIACLSCGEPIVCPHCSVPMTLHQKRTDAAIQTERYADGAIIGILNCHYCGERLPPPTHCPSCRGGYLHAFGYGTERAEEDVAERFPDLKILRMDTDTTQGKFAHEELLGRFRRREADLLLGTQMVTKGHDFPYVTLVGVLSADALLYQDDFKASEKAFSLITQVIGRAGRGDRPGYAVIQTCNPENEVLKLAAKQDFEAFYHSAIRMRKEMLFPPFCDMVQIVFSSDTEAEVMHLADQFGNQLRAMIAPNGAYANLPIVIFGPFEAQIYKMNDKYRMRVVLKCRMEKRTRAMLAELMRTFSACCRGSMTISIDVNPNNL